MPSVVSSFDDAAELCASGEVDQSRRARIRPYVAMIGCLPFVILAINNSWAFVLPAEWIDAFVYTGYFLDLKHHLKIFPDAYYGTRLPWILLGTAVHWLLGFELAQYA